MNLSHAYGRPPSEADAVRLLHHALDLGIRHFDTAALYGFGKNESLLGHALAAHRSEIHLASKCGMTGVDGKRVIDGHPETLLKTIDEALQRLCTDHIDLYYLHRWDKSVPIEDSIGALALMVEQGKVGAIGLSEVSAATLMRAHAVHPIAAVQSEYSLWSRNAEIAVLDTCREIGATFVAFSPMARGFLANPDLSPATFPKNDIRHVMPRFHSPHFEPNSSLARRFAELAARAGYRPSQLALGWLLAQGDHILPIPGTSSTTHLAENFETLNQTFDASLLSTAGELINNRTVSGPRYTDAVQAEIDTEEF